VTPASCSRRALRETAHHVVRSGSASKAGKRPIGGAPPRIELPMPQAKREFRQVAGVADRRETDTDQEAR